MTSGIELSPKRRALLAELLKKQGIDVASTRIPRRAGDRARAPLSFAQERLWFLDRLEPGRATYNLPLALRLRGPLEVKALEQALAALVSRHEALRTTFADVDGRPEQVIGPPAAVPLPIVDLRALPEAEREDVLLRRAYEEVQRPFDLRRGPLFRSLLLWLDDEYYAVVLTLHHIVMDAWSMEVLARDIVALYQAAVSGAPAPLPELTIQYADYAVWQREWLHGKVLQEQLAYWKRQLAGIVPVLSLPTDRPRPPVLTYRGADFAFTLPNDLVDALRDLGQAEGASLFMTLLAAFNVLLYRYTGQEDILVGSPITNRQRAEVKDVMGFFLNTIALRTDLTGSPSFRELLRQVRATVGEAFAHQDLPFEKLVEELQPKRDMSHAPLVNVMFVLNTNTFAEPPRLAELTVEPLIIENQTANFDLTLSLIDVAGWEVSGTFGYNTDLFDAATIARMAGHFRTLLESLVIKPDQPLWDLLLLTETERRQLLVEWNDTQTNYPQAECIHALFEAQARRTPEAVAVVFEDRWLSYGELNSRANQLARCLQKLGVGPEVLVGICMERSLDMVIGLLGILKAGGAYLPLDPNYPKERLAFMLADSRVAVLLTQAQLAARLPQSEAAVVCLDTEWDAIAGESVEDLASYPTLDNLAYVIYTSGSTGRPKGVLVPHAGLLNLVFWHIESYRVKPTDRATQVASIGFDASVWELWPYLAAGASIHLIDDEETRIMPARLRDWLISRQITLSFLPTPLAEAVLSLEWPESYDLQVLLTGGDRLSSFAPAALKFKLVNHYGPTESSVVTTAGRVPPEDSQVGLPAIGKPIANTQVYLLDARLQPVPIGVPGELCIGSIGLARGYLNHPDLTAEKFIPNPFWKDEGGGRNASREAETPSSSPAPEAHPLPAAGAGRRGLIPQPASFRLYRTGDLCRYRPDGNIEFLGRIDHQVKVRGYRIEPGEIEAVLGQHPAIKDVVVVAQETPPDRRLVAYVVPRSAQPPTIAEMRECIQQRLPDYMIPAAFVTLEALPLTPSGKVDRRALRLLGAPEEARPELAGAYVAPRSPVETTLSNIWSQLLKVKQVGVHDNFFELGGDSILSIQVIARANQAGLHLTPKQLFQHQTIAELAAVVNTAPENQAEQGLVTGPVPLTPIQHWFFEQALPEPHQWNQALLLEVRGPVDAERLEQAVRQLLIHHDALRLRFEHNDTGWQQVNAAGEGASPFSRVDLSGRAEAEQKAILEATVSRLQTELDLKDGPLLRVAYFDLGTERPGRLFIAIHHLVVDGVSWRILLEDLQTAYRQLGQAQPISLPPKTTSFQEWTRRLEAYAQRVELRTELDYWLEQPWAAVAPLPTDIPHASRVEANRVASERSVLVELSEDETRALLQTVPEAYHSQINDVLLAALGLTLARWTGKQMFSVDLEGHGREDLFDGLDLSRTVGWFTSLFPVLLAVESNSEVGKTLKTVKEHLRGIPQHGLGYGLLRYLCQDREVADRLQTLPQAEVSFNYLGQLDQTLAGESMFAPARESTGPAHSPLGKRNHVLELNGAVIEGRLQMAWGYSEDLHRRATIEQLAEWFGEALRGLITHCLAPEAGGYTPSDFPIMKFNQLELDELFPVLGKGVEDIYPLTPMQEGMLFHCLVAPESGMYFERLSCTVRGELNPAAFEQAWQQAIARHTILRTAFQWEHRAEPFQVVYRQVRFPIEWHDWRELSAAEQAERLAAYLEADQKLGFDLARPPLLRLAFMRLSENTYQLVWSHHHLLLDGWSMPMLLKEVFGFYAAFCQGRSLRLEAPRPYRDYIAWLQQQDQTAAEAFWRKALHGFTAPTALTIDRTARSAVLEGEGEYAGQGLRLSAETTAALQRFSRQQQVTLNTMVQGAWALLLSRYSGEEDVVFGVTVSGRPAELAGIENILGMFINTLPLRVRTPPEGRLLTWLKALQAQQVELRQYEYSPLVKVQGWSDVARGRPLFESLVVFENYPVDSTQREGGQGLELSNVQIVEKTNYPLTLIAMPDSELSIGISYACRRFDEATIVRVLGHLQVLLEEMVTNPERRLAHLSLLTRAERQQLLVDWNATDADYSRNKCIHEVFEAQVEQTPDAVAVVFGDQQLTYQELNRRANQLAHYLQARGVRPDVTVGLCLERSLELAIGVLGILKAGGAYLPLDPAYPLERLAYMLETATQAQPRTGSVLVTQTSLLEHLPVSASTRVVCLDADAPAIRQESEDSPRSDVTPDNLCYVIFTSGSTGKPKGVMLPHRALVNLCAWQRGDGLLPQPARTLQFAPLSFDVSCQEFFSTWSCGGTLVLMSDAPRRDPEALLRLLSAEKVERVFLPFVALHQLAEAAENDERVPLCLRDIVTAGEQLHITRPILNLLNRLAGCALHNQYGPTESHVATAFTLRGSADTWPALPPIGQPIANARMYVLDAQLQPAPIGVAGELYIGGAGLARGYLGRPDLTAEKFIPNPFAKDDYSPRSEAEWEGGRRNASRESETLSSSPVSEAHPLPAAGAGRRGLRPHPSALLYKSGDLARWRPDGHLEFLGRLDQQVKVRGFRVELGEIEAVLGQHAGVREAVVVAREDSPGDKRLVAYLVPVDAPPPTVSDLRGFVQRQLPEYMLPAVFVMLEALPLTPSGKVDRRALPAPDQARPALAQAFALPRTVAEARLARVWAEVLKVERVGVDDNFFELGGDSILSLRVVALAKQAGLSLTPRQLFEHPTIAGLAALANTAPALQAEQGPVTGPVPLTPNQHWFFGRNLEHPGHWNIPMLLETSPDLKPALLKEVMRALLVQHDILRARFAREATEWRQFITAPDETVPFTAMDLSESPEAEQSAVLQTTAIQLQNSMDLARGHLMQAVYFDLGAQQPGRLLFVLHHLISDAYTIQVLAEDFQSAYRQLARGEPIQLPPKTTSYQAWAEKQAAYAQSAELRRELDYWVSLPWERVTAVPLDFADETQNTVASTRVITEWLGVSETEALLKANRMGAQDVLLAAFGQTLAHWIGNPYVLFTLIINGRDAIFPDIDLSRTVGLFALGIPVILDLRNAETPETALANVKEQIARIPNRGITHGIMQRLTRDASDQRKKMDEDTNRRKVVFNYVPPMGSAAPGDSFFRPAREPVGSPEDPANLRDYVLKCTATTFQNQFAFLWEYGENIHQRATIEKVAHDFLERLRALVAYYGA